MAAPKAISIYDRRQHAIADRRGGYALAAQHTPAERTTIGQRAADTRWHNKALDKCKTDQERAWLRANPVEWARRADIWKDEYMTALTERSKQARNDRSARTLAHLTDCPYCAEREGRVPYPGARHFTCLTHFPDVLMASGKTMEQAMRETARMGQELIVELRDRLSDFLDRKAS